ncbi:hypothetical protein FHX42_001224 [Saccharopolyspora lacisalsi]|uniref:Uncharacterized protein n=1 Tax=Halosaccharopolyspora lacisalsi TaxID=1000566 RepID=A0A839DX19_9PSEU|nr:hypothetical protein [Halosaccharopolyspora lacisalsi]
MGLTPFEHGLLQRYGPETELGWMVGQGSRHAYVGHPLARPATMTALCAVTVHADQPPTGPEALPAPVPTCASCWRRAVLIRTRRAPPDETDQTPEPGSEDGHRTDKHLRPRPPETP